MDDPGPDCRPLSTTIPNINIHISNILKEGELNLERTIKDYLIVQKEGTREVSRKIAHYNLEMIIAIGERSSEDGQQTGSMNIWSKGLLWTMNVSKRGKPLG